ncbi:hypothetical protein BKA64DRAFT_770267 [Cadophora sp. MPI-SDFR-AT-0126]|nr:hypothetical protein BKA64DRAFT_770267 [Leotiomycetes sp. MPI-SDFR-AT-0126]
MDDDDINSSDIEVELPVDPFASAGTRSIQEMLEFSVVDRLESKKRSKQLRFSHGSKKTQYINHLWYNRFQGFRSGVLRVDIDTSPKGEQLERFLTSIVARVVPRGAHAVPSYKWLQHGLGHLVNAIVFYHKDFTLSKHERSRIETTIQELFHEGKITRDPSIERNHIGVYLVRKLSTGILRDALANGTLNWDVTLAKALSIVLTAGLASRTGDITVAPMDVQELPYLCYKDITLKLVGGDGLTSLVAEVLIRNEKGDKGNGRKNRKVKLETLKSPSNNVICPIKLLLVVALRHGNVQETNVDEFLRVLSTRRDKTVQWVHPKRPVLCAFGNVGSSVQADKPAGNHQLSNNMAQAAPVAGFLAKRVRSHDLRRGAARDAANLNSKIKGFATEAVAATLGHSDPSITKAYVGDIRDSVYTMRVEEDFKDPFGVETTDKHFVKRRKLSKAAITDLCEEDGVDAKDAKARKRVGRNALNKTVQDWSEAAREEDVPSVLLEQSSSEVNANMSKLATINRVPVKQQGPVQQDSTTLFIDPRLLTGDIGFEDLVEDDTEEPTAAVEEAYFDEVVSQTTQTSSPELLIDGVDFVRYFSKINMSNNQVLAQFGHHEAKAALIASNYAGYSKDPVALWIFSCENAMFGCQYKNSLYAQVLEHQRTCKFTSAEAYNESIKVKAFPCDREGCGKSFDSKGRLTNHINEVHDWKKRGCDKDGCDPKVLFETRKEFLKHGQTAHSPYTPSRCLFPGCPSTIEFKSSKTYRSHLSTHGITDRKEKDKYMPGKKAAFVPQLCRVPKCTSTMTFAQPNRLRTHLADKHGFTEDEIEDYLF